MNQKPWRQRSLAALIGFACIPALQANEMPEIPGEDYFFSDLPVVLSATRLAQPLSETPAALTVIDREMIRASGALTIPDLLRLVPGFQVGFITGREATVTYHGMADEFARDMQVLIDGRSIYNPGFGGVSWPLLPLGIDDIQRIEVIRGSNAAAYGSNAFAGIINIITQHPAEQAGTYIKATAGSNETRQVQARYSGSAGGLDYRLSTGYDATNGFDQRPDTSHARWLSFRGDYQQDTDDHLLLEAGYSHADLGEGFYDDPSQPPRNTHSISNFQQLKWTHSGGPDQELNVQLYHNYLSVHDDFAVLGFGPPPIYLGYGFTTHRIDLELQYMTRLGEGLRAVSGAGGRYDSIESFWLFGSDQTFSRGQLRAFTNIEWRLRPDVLVNLGGMYEKYEGKSGLFSPRLALNYHVNPRNTLRIIASQAYRMPTLWEDNANLQAWLSAGMIPVDIVYKTENDLEPERITSFELGYLGNFPEYGTTLDVRLFHEEIQDTISDMHDVSISLPPWQQFPGFEGAGTYRNGGHATLDGLDLDLRYTPSPGNLIKIGYSLITLTGSQLKDDLSGSYIYRNLREHAPRHTLSLLGSFTLNQGIELSSAFYYTSVMTWGGDGTDIPESTRWDLRIGKTFQFSESDLSVALVAQNLDGDTIDFYDYASRNQLNNWESRLFLQMELHFQ